MNHKSFQPFDSKANKIVWILFLLYISAYSFLSIRRHQSFNSTLDDLAVFDQIVWNISRTRLSDLGALVEDIRGKNYFRGHFSPIIFVFAPLYWVWENVIMILLAQSVLLGTGIFAVYRFARLELDSNFYGLLFCLLYILYPPLGFINRYDFHPVACAIPLILFAWVFQREERWRETSICLALALICKETVGLTLFAASLVMACKHAGHRRFWLVWGLVSITFSLVSIYYIIPYFNGGNLSEIIVRYYWLGKTPGAIIRQFITHPWESFLIQFGIGYDGNKMLFGALRLTYLVKMFLPFVFLPFLGGSIILAVAPALFYNILSSSITQGSIYFHYNSPIIPFLFIGAVLGFKRIRGWCGDKSRKKITTLVTALLIIFSTVSFIHDNPFTRIVMHPYYPNVIWQPVSGIREFYEAARLIPPEASVQTTYNFGPHLSHRQELHYLYRGGYFADYLIFNRDGSYWYIFHDEHVKKALNHPNYEKIYSKKNIVLLKRRAHTANE